MPFVITAAIVFSKHVQATRYWPMKITTPVTYSSFPVKGRSSSCFVLQINWCCLSTKTVVSSENEAPDGKKRKETPLK